MSFPIIRLAKTSIHNASLTDDLSKAHATLYTFLRSVPSESEVELAMREFERALHSTDSLLNQTNIRSVILLESVIQDFLLRDPPYVNPTWNSQPEGLQEVLMLSARRAFSTTAKDSYHNELERSGASICRESSGNALVGAEGADHELHVPMEEIKVYKDPFQAYEEHYQDTCGRHSQDHSPRNVEPVDGDRFQEEKGNEPLEHSRDVGLSGDLYKGVGASGSGAAASFPMIMPWRQVTPENGSKERRSGSFDVADAASSPLSCERSLFPQMPSTDLSDYHPLLEALVLQVRGVLMANEENKEYRIHAAFDRDDLEFHKTMLDVFAHIHERLHNAREEVEQAAEAHRECASIWDPSHAHYKESLKFVQHLSERTRAAEDLYTVERSEQETIRIAYCALSAEVITMRLLLRDVKRLVEEAVTTVSHGRSDDAGGIAKAELQLVEEIRDVLGVDSTVGGSVE
ncbi:unnamed protein product [Phytomonas sp. EM1]|nr:unnamed protein product [Phytomonas sp. EM1]|eukprot:CCW60295.1 unnamed protein product [Phytomonas sp. isolate EM1]